MEILTDLDHDNILKSTLEYSKYLYEEENLRRDRLNNAVKVYLGFLTFILGVGAFKLVSLGELSLLLNTSAHQALSNTGIILLGLSLLLLIVAFVLTIRVLKMWTYERLCDPKAMAVRSVFLEDNRKILSSMISDYVVACNVNHHINNQKSTLLTRALSMLIIGLIMLVTSVFILKAIMLVQESVK